MNLSWKTVRRGTDSFGTHPEAQLGPGSLLDWAEQLRTSWMCFMTGTNQGHIAIWMGDREANRGQSTMWPLIFTYFVCVCVLVCEGAHKYVWMSEVGTSVRAG